ncbi:MAG: TerC family protein [Betaproteobacteria bacterium]|nr:TerC family protein [Betaproteobacteria bacterium]
MVDPSSPAIWVSLGEIALVNILLSGDNAVMIALAARSLPPHQQKKAIIGGSIAAIILLVVLTTVVANLIMSMDNVLGVAAVARRRVALLIAGLGISIPVIVFGSTLVLGLMTRFPVIIKLGAALLGWVAGDMLVSDPVIASYVESNLFWTRVHLPLDADFNLVQVLGAVLVIAVGRVLASRSTRTAL